MEPYDGFNSVFIAIKEGNLNMLKKLRNFGADLDISVKVGIGDRKE